MAKNSIRDFDNTAGNNTDIQSVDIAENCAPSGINNAIRELMADMADVNDGTVALVSPAMDSADINGGTIDGTVIGGTTPAAGTFTTGDFNTSLNVDGTVTSDGLTVDGSVDVNGATSFDIQTTNANPIFERTDAAVKLATRHSGVTTSQYFTDTDGSLSLRADPTNNLAGSYFNITVDGTTALTIDDSQNVGIGIATPSTDLHLFKTTGDVGITVQSSATANAKAFVDLYGRDASNVNQIWKIENDAHSLKIKDDGSTKMTLDTSGNVGIGTNSPVEKLYVNSTSGDARIGLNAPTGSDTEIKFFNNGTVNYTVGHDDGTDNFVIGTANVDTPLVSVNKSGSVGIGTSSPSQKLTVQSGTSSSPAVNLLGAGSSQGWLRLGNNADIKGGDDYLGMTFTVGASERMRIDSSGRVGIGTSSPASILQVRDVNPDVYITSDDTGQSDIYFGGSTSPTKGRIQYSDNADIMAFWVDSSERMRIDSSGNLLVGVTSTTIPGVSNTTAGVSIRGDDGSFFSRSLGSGDTNNVVTINRTTADGNILGFNKDGSTVGSIGNQSTTLYISSSQAGGLRYTYSGSNPIIAPCNTAGANLDNSADLGFASARFDDIYATNGTIQTSDQNEKQQIASLTDAEITAAKAISKLFKTFKWNDSVEEKGDAARTHTGVIAQDVQQAMTEAGLDAGDYAFFISATWWETQTEVPAVEAVEAQDAVYETQTDEEGNETQVLVSEAVEAVEAQDAYTRTDTYDTAEEAPEGATERTRMGIRYPELLAFIGAATEQRLADIETRLTALEN